MAHREACPAAKRRGQFSEERISYRSKHHLISERENMTNPAPEINPGQTPQEIPAIPNPQPEIEPSRTPEPEVPEPPPDPGIPARPTGPEIDPNPGPPEVEPPAYM
jgi:hypothetical protein